MSDVSASDVPTCDFPREDSLCERCGYALRGLPYGGDCPECGLKIEESDPAKRRPGLPWQDRMSLRNWWRTIRIVARRPARSFDVLSVSTSESRGPLRDRVFLAIIAIIIGVMWVACSVLTPDMFRVGSTTGNWHIPILFVPMYVMVVAACVIALTYIEALGVAWFSWRRGWRVPFRLAERVSCYASIGWVPAGILCNLLWLWYDKRLFRGGWYPFFQDERDLLILTAVAMLTILWFEWLVWLGVRRVKYANAR